MYIIILSLSLLIGIWFANFAIVLSPLVTIFLASIFFLSALKINLKDVAEYATRKKTIVLFTLLSLIALPVAVFFITKLIAPELAVALMILATMPPGMTSPLLAEIAGGKQSLALVLTVVASLLAPFTVPIIIKALSGASVQVSILTMFKSLAQVIFIPFVLANVVKYVLPGVISRTQAYYKTASIVLLGLLITGIVSRQAPLIKGSLTGDAEAIHYLLALFTIFIVFHVIGYFVFSGGDHSERITITVCFAYVNFTLAIYLVDKFFNDPHVIVPVVLSVLPWSILLVPFRWLTSRISHA